MFWHLKGMFREILGKHFHLCKAFAKTYFLFFWQIYDNTLRIVQVFTGVVAKNFLAVKLPVELPQFTHTQTMHLFRN